MIDKKIKELQKFINHGFTRNEYIEFRTRYIKFCKSVFDKGFNDELCALYMTIDHIKYFEVDIFSNIEKCAIIVKGLSVNEIYTEYYNYGKRKQTN